MIATNHALTGAIIGLSVSNPLLAVTLALVSHFALDGLPHYSPAKPDLASNEFRNYLIVDALLCIVLVAVLAGAAPHHWLLASICAFAATLPDTMWIPDFLRARRSQKQVDFSERGILVRLHDAVQWYAKPLGAVTEVIWFAGGVTVLATLIR
jgi:hypothetical protein